MIERLDYAAILRHYSEAEVVDLTLIVAQMNASNRIAIGFGHQPDGQLSANESTAIPTEL